MIFFCVDHPGLWWTGSFMENPVLIEVSLFDVRVSMAILLVHEVELLCQVLTG
jgi:hypothetical protein